MAAILGAFAFGIAGGFVYAHDPQPPEFRTSLSSAPPPADTAVRGTLSAVAPGYIEVTNADGARRLEFGPAVPVEELIPLEGGIPDRAPVNVGGNRTESGFVLTGVVVLGGAP